MDTAKLKLIARSEREIVMTRDFKAPRRLVFDALTKPDLVKRWLGVFGGWELAVCEIDLKVGGAYRYLWRSSSGGNEMGVRGTYREVVPHERLVCTELFDEPWYPGESLVTTTLAEQAGKTMFTCAILYASREARDGVLKSGMERGVSASYDKLAEVLESTSAIKGATNA